tara:strand:- start:1160 stop:1492 length:333 start_codon:yes stop_codon:yes gene_type:complete
MGIIDPDVGRIGGNTFQESYQDPFLRPGFKPRPPIVNNPPPVDKPIPDDLPELKPGKPDVGLSPSGVITVDQIVADTQEQEKEEFKLTDDQRYMLIGLVVLGGILGFIKK